ncbi:hypothetical protein M0813_07029 [Anaeramoeba flamelloides]|uniref:Uncharacterized protein n=1 Tax=Anaeramoeba flamelloides TaxID=1746091 RepID=A0ABQ8XE49_9EUKA|nr:hypothetical protein M0813_07029 [Anaeramoeba flamelloides]
MNNSITFSTNFSEGEIYNELQAEHMDLGLNLDNNWGFYNPKYYEMDNFIQERTLGYNDSEQISVKYFDPDEKMFISKNKQNEENENENEMKHKRQNGNENEIENENENENENEKEQEKEKKGNGFELHLEDYFDYDQNNEFQKLDLDSDFWFNDYLSETNQTLEQEQEQEQEREREKEKEKEKEKEEEEEEEGEGEIQIEKENFFPFNGTQNNYDEENVMYGEEFITIPTDRDQYEEIISPKQYYEIGEKNLKDFTFNYEDDLELFYDQGPTEMENEFFDQSGFKTKHDDEFYGKQTNERTISTNNKLKGLCRANSFFSNGYDENEFEIKKEQEKGCANGNLFGQEIKNEMEIKKEWPNKIERGKDPNLEEDITQIDQHFSEMKIDKTPGHENRPENGREEHQNRKQKKQPKKSKTKTKTIRKRIFKETSNVTLRPEVVESGKELFKLFVGLLWVVSGGASHSTLTPASEAFVSKISQVLQANDLEEKEFKSQLRYLLSNSRRTFTEYVLEILLGVLSLSVHPNKPKLSVQLKKIIQQIKDIQLTQRKEMQELKKKSQKNNKKTKKKKANMKKSNEDNNNNNNSNKETENGKGKGKAKGKGKNNTKRKKKKKKNLKLANITNIKNNNNAKKKISNEEETKKIINENLEKLFPQIFTQPVLMFWFEKRFANKLNYLLTPLDKTQFYQRFLYPLVKSKFISICWILAREFLKRDGPLKKYCKNVNLVYNNNPLNLYSNNRGPKLKLIKQIIVKFGLNNSNYWVKSIDLFQSEYPLDPQSILTQRPFSQIINSPMFDKFFPNSHVEKSNKKRTFATKSDNYDQNINVGWILKSSEYGGAPNYDNQI